MSHTKRVQGPARELAATRTRTRTRLHETSAFYIGSAVLHTILVTAILAVMIPFFNISARDNQQDMLSVQPHRGQTSSGGIHFLSLLPQPNSLLLPYLGFPNNHRLPQHPKCHHNRRSRKHLPRERQRQAASRGLKR